MADRIALQATGRSPQGERGLKLQELTEKINNSRSLPAGGAWIEMDP